MRRAVVVLLLAAAACSSSSPSTQLTVASQNLYLGGDIFLVAQAASPVAAAVATWQVWNDVKASNFPARAKVLAASLAAQNPDVIGLQEVAVWRTGVALVCASGGSQYINNPQAATVVYDFLASLQTELAALGLQYTVARNTTTFDAELCAVDPTQANAPIDVRYTDHDVILVRTGLTTRNAAGGTYQAKVTFPIAGTGVEVPSPRGWNVVEVQKDGNWFRVFETHLEVQELPTAWPIPPWIIQLGQAGELIAGQVNPRSALAPLPTIVLGDMNSQADQPAGSPLRITYNYLSGLIPFPDYGYPPFAPLVGSVSSLSDAWTAANPGQAGLTWGYTANLQAGSMSQRIDLVLLGGGAGTSGMTTIGAGQKTATTPALYGSDHLGVVAGIQLP